MLLSLLFAFLGGSSLIILGLGYKHASVVKSHAWSYGSVFMGIAALITLSYSFFENSAWCDWRLWAIGLAMGVTFVLCIGLYTRANLLGPPSTSWVVLNLSCLPAIALAVAFRLPGERFVWLDGLIIALFVGMILALHAGMKENAKVTQERIHPLFWPLVLATFAFNSVYLFLLKLKNLPFPTEGGNNGATLAICFGSAGIVVALYHLVSCHRRKEIPWRKDDIVAGAMTGLGAGMGNILILKAMSLPTVVVLPITQGIPIIGGVIAMALIYRERFNRAKAISVLLALATLLLAIFRDRL